MGPRSHRDLPGPAAGRLEAGPDGRPPRPRRRPNQPQLVPSHPDLSASRIEADLVADCLQAWADASDSRFLVIDTHPGANHSPTVPWPRPMWWWSPRPSGCGNWRPSSRT